ncbi:MULTISPECIES: hypothetical protein [Chelativorans]|jgi:hypothetical protein|uniref:Uncharacterized protein n=1 Tax=Chelativorans sp. (strain BNC1) TaxID=266779 RepID=Q11DC2_CHESB|nr:MULTISPECIES: hypothetical protein [Chelativorans]
MRCFIAVAVFLLLAGSSRAQEISSAYTQLDSDQHCAVLDRAEKGDGDWAELVCSGYKGFPVFLSYDDARESLFYGFPPQNGQRDWESFAAFNSAGPTVEWRIETNGDRELPFATIHRRFVSADPEKPDVQTEVLVVSRVGTHDGQQGCVVGYVVATSNPDANEKARRIADERARAFTCGTDQPAVESGSVPLPEVTRGGDSAPRP